METLKCIISQNKKRNLPEFDFKLIFENDFFKDEYILESEKKIPEYRKVKYDIQKNGEFIGSLFMENYKFNDFMSNFMDIIDDYDVRKLYENNVQVQLSENYNKFIDSFEMDIKQRPNNLIGEIYKMRRVAGLL